MGFNERVQPTIQALAAQILGAEELKMTEQVAARLQGDDSQRLDAVRGLLELIGDTPKRPVYYLRHEIKFLPEYTRHVVRYAGDYLDQLIKYCSYEKGDFAILKSRGLRTSLGSNLKRLRRVLPEGLLAQLKAFNEIIYVPAKHEWYIPEDSPHLFSAKEAVLVLFMVRRLADEILPYSPEAQMYNSNEKYDYHYDSTQH